MTEQTKQQPTTNPGEPGKDKAAAATIDREEMQRLYEESCSGIQEGSIVKGIILLVSNEEVYVDIGYKSEGVVHISEFSDLEEVKPGTQVDVLLESKEDPDGMVVLSRIKAEKQKRWDETILRSKEGDVVRGKLLRKVRGGVIVDIGMDAFLPASQIDIRHVGNVDDYIGKVFDFKVIKINSDRKNIVLSRRELLEEERARNRERLLSELEVGESREGIVKNITDFGAFIDLYGMDGLLHITDMTWGRINHPSEMLSIGDKVEVVILDFDREKQRIALGLKQTTTNPWQNIETKYPVGSIVKGKIVNIVPYGAFIEIERGVEGLIHISEMCWTKRISHPSEILSVGDEVEAMVLNIKKDEAKISLGIKQTEFNPWSVVEEKYPPGTHLRGRVRNITSYGAFVELEEGIDGLIHISDMSWTRKINHPSEMLKKGEMTEAIVLAVDQEAKKITLGLKQLEANPWETIDVFVRVSSTVEATVTKIADFGVFATLENGIECLIHISQLSEKPFQKIEDIVKRGDKVLAKVDRIDRQRRKIALSIREYQRDVRLEEEAAAREAAKALSLGDQSISGMKEHLEQAMEELSPPEKTREVPEEIQEEAPVAEEPAASEIPIAEDETPMDWGTFAAEQEAKLTEDLPTEPREEIESEYAPATEPAMTPKETPSAQVTFWGDEFVKPAEQVNLEEETPPREELGAMVVPDALQPELPFEVMDEVKQVSQGAGDVEVIVPIGYEGLSSVPDEAGEQGERLEDSEELPEAESPDPKTDQEEPRKEGGDESLQ